MYDETKVRELIKTFRKATLAEFKTALMDDWKNNRRREEIAEARRRLFKSQVRAAIERLF